ncbi:MAG TPA: 16S rRNA (cytosine(1402)-N(4))-methyltransferase RsmH [Candidatus Dormibacteraeota bacterium]|nr:16S rRNA (cytosine(1402)-N(4))-methyltransferase RsmH [Candidatus Dormibacteraeota bacterium]
MANDFGDQRVYDRRLGTSGHRPVLLQELIESLRPAPGQAFVDATLGGGGYARALIERLRPGGTLLGIDRDASAIERFRREPVPPDVSVTLAHTNFARLAEVAAQMPPINGVVFDLGLSSDQLDDPARGFSFQRDGPLDMRIDLTEPGTAADLVNHESVSQLRRILIDFGQERWAARIAQRIVEQRQRKPLHTTKDLADLVAGAIPRAAWPRDIHVATRTFMAIRIAVNRELDAIETGLKAAIQLLATGGRVGVVSFHSLEDKIAKNLFNVEAKDCICPPQAPVCICGHRRSVRVITRKPITASESEVRENPRARSAKLRIAEKL